MCALLIQPAALLLIMNKKLLELREYVENLWEVSSVEEMQSFYQGLTKRIDALLQELAKNN